MKFSAVDQNNQVERFELLKDEKIGEGATALVYKVNYKNQTWAAKIFKDGQKINSLKLQAMLESQPDDLIINIDGQDFIQYAWVKYLIKNRGGKVVGFMMPYVAHDETYSLDTFYDPVLSKRIKPFEAALTLRIQLAINLCELIEKLHNNKNYFIDIKPQNIKVYKKNHKVVLLDCDGYSINNGNGSPERFEAELISTDYIAPEVTRENLKPSSLGLQQDLYGLAVILFQLLNRGTHPFQGITTDKNISASTNDERASLGLYAYGLKENLKVKPRTQSIHNLFLDETRALFDKSFETESRTTAEEWIKHFKEILDNKKLELCDKVDRSKKLEKDLIHIKFNGKECIGCKIELIKPLKNKNKRTYNVNSSNSNNNSINSTPFKTSSYYHNTPVKQPEEFNFSKFFFYAAVIIFVVVLIGKCSESSKDIGTSVSSNIQVSPTPIQDNESCNIDIKNSSPIQLCNSYWSKNIKNSYSCNNSIAKELLDRDLSFLPEEYCGKQIKSKLIKEEAYPDKVNKLVSTYGVSTISSSIVKNSPENLNLYREVVNEIVTQFKEADKTAEFIDGLRVLNKINLPYVSKVVWYASEQSTCTDKSLGIKESCLIQNGSATCQLVELNVNFKVICVESFTK
jgi:serine/threonine protein kinase